MCEEVLMGPVGCRCARMDPRGDFRGRVAVARRRGRGAIRAYRGSRD